MNATATSIYTAWKRCADCGIEINRNASYRDGCCESCWSARLRVVRPPKVCTGCGVKVHRKSRTNLCRKCSRIGKGYAVRTKCEACDQPISPDEPRYKLTRLNAGGKNQGSGTLKATLCDRCGEASEKAYPKIRQARNSRGAKR